MAANPVIDSQTYDYRGKQFAAQNAFCNGATRLIPAPSVLFATDRNTSQTVEIDQPTSSSVRAIVSQQQPAYLAEVLGLSTVNIGAFKPLPKSRTRKTYVGWDLDFRIGALHSAAVPP